MSNVKERILRFIEFKGLKKEKFFSGIGMSYGSFKGKAKKTPINSKAIEKILHIFPELNAEWLILGKGPMLKTQNQGPGFIHEQSVNYNPQNTPASEDLEENLRKALRMMEDYKKMINILRSEIKFLKKELEKCKEK